MQSRPTKIPKQFSNLSGLGAPVEVYQAKGSLVLPLIVSAALFLGGGGALAYVLYIFWVRWGRYYPPVIFRTTLPWLAGALIAFGLAGVVLWNLYSNRKRAAVVYTQGLACSDRKGVRGWRWDQIRDVTANVIRHYTSGIYTGTTRHYTLANHAGEKLILTDKLQNIESLYSRIQNNTLQLRYQRLSEAYNQGNPVSFGPVTIGKQSGIKIYKKTYSWDAIEEVAINKGMLSVKKKGGGWFSSATVAAGSIPNLHVLLSIINQVVGLKAGK